jgi:hypothetical protein
LSQPSKATGPLTKWMRLSQASLMKTPQHSWRMVRLTWQGKPLKRLVRFGEDRTTLPFTFGKVALGGHLPGLPGYPCR